MRARWCLNHHIISHAYLQIEAETPDMWLGLLREPKLPGSPIGPTLRAVLVEQFHRSFFGPGGFYWEALFRTLRAPATLTSSAL